MHFLNGYALGSNMEAVYRERDDKKDTAQSGP